MYYLTVEYLAMFGRTDTLLLSLISVVPKIGAINTDPLLPYMDNNQISTCKATAT